MTCITQADMNKLENQVLQYQIAYDAGREEYQAEYNKRGKGVSAPSGADPRGERAILSWLLPIGEKVNEAKRQRDQYKKLEICEDIEKKKQQQAQQQAQTVATERIKELEELLKLSGEELKLSGEELKLSGEELKLSGEKFTTAQVKHETLTNQYFFAVAGIVLVGILFFRRRA